MFEVMAELEAMAVRLAARRIPRGRDGAHKAHKACVEAANGQDYDAYYYANEQFHFALYAASHQGFLIEQCKLMDRRLKPYRRLQLRVRQRVPASLAEHEAIMQAVLAFDGDSAAQRVREHVLVQGERFSELLASMQPAKSSASRKKRRNSAFRRSFRRQLAAMCFVPGRHAVEHRRFDLDPAVPVRHAVRLSQDQDRGQEKSTSIQLPDPAHILGRQHERG